MLFCEDQPTKQIAVRLFYPVFNNFLKASVCIAVVILLGALRAQPFIDFTEVNSFALDNFCRHPIFDKIIAADEDCCTGL